MPGDVEGKREEVPPATRKCEDCQACLLRSLKQVLASGNVEEVVDVLPVPEVGLRSTDQLLDLRPLKSEADDVDLLVEKWVCHGRVLFHE